MPTTFTVNNIATQPRETALEQAPQMLWQRSIKPNMAREVDDFALVMDTVHRQDLWQYAGHDVATKASRIVVGPKFSST